MECMNRAIAILILSGFAASSDAAGMKGPPEFSDLALKAADIKAALGDIDLSAAKLPPLPVAAVSAVSEIPSYPPNYIDYKSEPGSGLNFIELQPFHHEINPKWSPVIQDIMNHAPGAENSFGDLVTDAHETIHDINYYLRSHKASTTSTKPQGFYIGNNLAVLLPEPKMNKSQIKQFIPTSLHGFRYEHYIGTAETDGYSSLFILNEFTAYIHGTETLVDLAQYGLWTGGKRGASGPVEFLVYSLATGMALKVNEPDYYGDNPQFREFLGFMTKRAMKTYSAAAQFSEFNWDDNDAKIHAALKESPEAAPLRAYAQELFGAEWTRTNLGF